MWRGHLTVPVLSMGNGPNGALTPISRQFVSRCMFFHFAFGIFQQNCAIPAKKAFQRGERTQQSETEELSLIKIFCMICKLKSYSGSPPFGLLVLLVFDNSLGPRSPGLCLLKLPAWSVCQLWSTTTQQARTRQKLSFQSYASSTLSTLKYNNRQKQDKIIILIIRKFLPYVKLFEEMSTFYQSF